MDNFHIDITAEKLPSLQHALAIAFAHNAPGQKVESYDICALTEESIGPEEIEDVPEEVRGKPVLIFRWAKRQHNDPLGYIDLPFKLDVAGAADFAWRWLAEQDYGRQPDHDGDNDKGWRLFTTGIWGHVAGDHYAVCAIAPVWAMYGK